MDANRAITLLIVLLLNFFFVLSSADHDEPFTVASGVSFGRSSREPKFDIDYHPPDSPFHPDNGYESMVITNKEGQKYMCFLPVLEETKTLKSLTQQNSSSVVVETDGRHKLKTPDELMEVLKDRCIVRHEGWWTYELCYQKKLRQVHLHGDKIVQEFILGVFDAEATAAFNENNADISMLKDPRSRDASQRYHAHLFTNGTTCDLTHLPRETEVRFVCSEHAVVISSIMEISTCKYVVTIQCPMLCKHPMFQHERPSWYTIHCNEMPKNAAASAEDELSRDQIVSATDEDDDSERYAT